jgi:hypothetical protein
MKLFGRTSVSEFLGDMVVYRNLVPRNPQLPDLDALRGEAGLAPGQIPRKSEPDYARVIVGMLRRARPGVEIKRLLYVGDTRLNDGTAFANVAKAGEWPGMAFIASENAKPAEVEISTDADRTLYFSNRWADLPDFDRYIANQNFPVDEQTAIIIDLDKTALGARGRNAHVIDGARVQAVRDTIATLLGGTFNEGAFRTAYDRLNQVEYHPFTTDNQDYLAYMCLVLGIGLYDLDTVADDILSGKLTSFTQSIDQVNDRAADLPSGLDQIHHDIYANVQAGDPTPFKAFRRTEFLTTVGRMGQLPDDSPVETLLDQEIVITQEVLAYGLDWKERGALLFGLSDKPDEASIPTDEQVSQGYKPIHRTETHVVGAG